MKTQAISGMSLKQAIAQWLLPPAILHLARSAKFRFGRLMRMGADDRRLLRETRLLARRHQGSRCFILGAGPSIKRQDLRKLRGEFVLSVSNTYVHPDYAYFRPRYHFLPPILAWPWVI